MRKRLVKKLQKKNKYELDELEELLILAHRINKTETGCVFIRDSAHINLVRFEICFNKEDYSDTFQVIEIRYGESSSWNNSLEIASFKERLIRLSEELDTKKD